MAEYTCPQCSEGVGEFDGCLGRFVWLTCRACGWEFSVSTQKYIDDGGTFDE